MDADSLITEEMRAWIGRSTPVLELPEAISPSDVRRYVEATGDRNPLWLDDAFARSVGYRGRLVPPMMVLELFRRTRSEEDEAADPWARIPLPPNYTDTRNAGTDVEWLKPVYLDDRLSIQSTVADIVARQGKAGLGIYVTREESIFNAAKELVLRRRQTLVRLPARSHRPEGG
jgi:acyl dehydratase